MFRRFKDDPQALVSSNHQTCLFKYIHDLEYVMLVRKKTITILASKRSFQNLALLLENVWFTWELFLKVDTSQ